MSAVKTLRGLHNRYDAAPQRVRSYFRHVPGLVKDYPLDVCLSWMFAQVELAHNMTIYCGAVKLHKTESELTWHAIQAQHMTRSGFQRNFEQIFGKAIPADIMHPLEQAEKIRDKVMHGKRTVDADKRQAIANVLEYAERLNDHLHKTAGLQPFGALSGFKGRAKGLDKQTTRWILKGMGFGV